MKNDLDFTGRIVRRLRSLSDNVAYALMRWWICADNDFRELPTPLLGNRTFTLVMQEIINDLKEA